MELTPEERNAGQWLVTDFPQSMNASLIPYTGDVSAANVGDAIDTLNQNLTNINVRYSNGKIQYYDGTNWVDWASVTPSTLVNVITAPLTSNTTPEGVASGTPEYGSGSAANVYKAFGLSNSNSYIFQAGSSPSLKFTFNEVTYVDVVQFDCIGNGSVYCSYQLQATYDGTTWFNCGSAVGTSSESWLPSQREIHAPIKAFRFVTSSGGAVGIGYRRVMAYKYN